MGTTAAREVRAKQQLYGCDAVRKLTRSASLCVAFAMFAVAGCAPLVQSDSAAPRASEVWHFDNFERIGGTAVEVEGDPQIVNTELGPAVLFDGVEDALFIETHPLANARHFTAEAIFRPHGGTFEQRWLHLAEAGDAPAEADPPVAPSGPRMLFEIRVVGERWYLDTFVAGPGYAQALIDPEKTFLVGRWYHVAQVYDGRTYRSYVNGELQAEAATDFQPQGPGHASVGTRIDRRDYFTGEVLTARFTHSALPPARFMPMPVSERTSSDQRNRRSWERSE